MAEICLTAGFHREIGKHPDQLHHISSNEVCQPPLNFFPCRPVINGPVFFNGKARQDVPQL